MSSPMGISLDAGNVLANLAQLATKIPVAEASAAEQIADEIMRLSQKDVPHDEGTLQNSGAVERDGDDWIVGYFTPYAARLHEHPEYNFQKGRKGKYLEDPILKNTEKLGLTYIKALEEGLS